jgi:hypothetical protein
LNASLLASLNQKYPGWQSASNNSGVFSFDAAPALTGAPANATIVVTVTQGGMLGSMAFTYAINGGAPQGPITSVAQQPNGPRSEYDYVFAVPGTNCRLSFQGGGPGDPATPLTNFPLSAVFTLQNGTFAFTATGLPAFANVGSYLDALCLSAPVTTTLTVATLNASVCGEYVLIQTNIGLGWTLGLVASDGTNVVTPGLLTPTLPASTRAVAGFTGYALTGADTQTYQIAGRSGDALSIWWAPSGQVAQFFTSSSLSTLGAMTGGLCLVEVAAHSPTDDAGLWRIISV